MFSGTAALLYPAPFGELIYFANLNEGSYRLGLGHNCGDRYTSGNLPLTFLHSCELVRARTSEKVDKSTSNLESKKS